jgi:phytoene synthase
LSLIRVRGHYENFPVASILLPPAMRPHVAAVYAFARTADDFADEGERAPEERLRLLNDWQRRLHHAARSNQRDVAPSEGEPEDTQALFLALGRTIREHGLPVELFDALLSAFRQDVLVHRYAGWSDLLDYCRRSANPVGRIVLRIAGYTDDRLDAWSDAICTALQLTNFWQDFALDWRRGRLYVPADVARAHGAVEITLDGGMTPEWRDVLVEAAARTRASFVAGRPLCDAVSGRLRYELRVTWLGGMRILERLEADRFDVFARRPALGRLDAARIACRTVAWRPTRRPVGLSPISSSRP